MDLRLQPKPEVEILPADRGIVSRKQYFVKKKFEKINKYFFSGHLIRDWKPKAELIYPPYADEYAIQYQCDFNRDVQNCFIEDNAEEVYLKTPPPCFVVFGKCGRSVNKLSQEIAKEFGSVLIQVDDVVNEVIKRKTETSQILEQLLRLGVSLTLNFILALLSYVAHTAEARHRGYVLCGLPRVPVLQDLPVEKQFNYLFKWENKPTVFINVLFNDEDLFRERTSLFCELKQTESEKIIFYHSEDEEDDENDEDENDELVPIKEDVFYERDIDISPSRPWIKLPKDEEFRVWSELEMFENGIAPAIELINSRVDPQYFITVDSRVGNELEVVLARLKLLQIWKVPVARFLIEPQQKTESIEDQNEEGLKEIEINPEIAEIVGEHPETAFLKLFTKNTISPKFRWELSHYNYICPVSLREGDILEGKSEFAVVFMKYIYFLRDEECARKFIENPRAYALPIRPKPLCRFFILGYPYSGKTTLAQKLASEFSIPLINFNTVLRNDLERKKNTYQEFCRKKAECREIIRLNCKAWRAWRLEEEQRLNLIQDWILFIQILLSRRIKEFYSSGSEDDVSAKELRQQPFSPIASSNVLTVDQKSDADSSECVCSETEDSLDKQEEPVTEAADCQPSKGSLPAAVSTSVEIVEVPKDDLKEKSLEVEANAFLSSLWMSFSGDKQKRKRKTNSEIFGEFGEYGEEKFSQNDEFEFGEDSDEYDPLDWCSLLPPQSLSSFLINRKPYTARQKRQSFHIFLEAASKAYWKPSALRAEFAKWHIPCFMDIPLCEIFLDNPFLLLNYVPQWLNERPLIPDPIDSSHPRVIEAGKEAFLRAECISIKQNEEEMGILLRDAIEKAEREGMRVTGEVISPGGWVVDDMTLDLNIWNKLISEKILADHVYILIDSEFEWRRIINMWWDFCGKFRESNRDTESEEIFGEEEEEYTEEESEPVKEKPKPKSGVSAEEQSTEYKSVRELLVESAKNIACGEETLDEIFRALVLDPDDLRNFGSSVSLDPFCLNFLQDSVVSLREDSVNEESLINIQNFNGGVRTSRFFLHQFLDTVPPEPILGAQLQIFTDHLLDKFKKRKSEEDEPEPEPYCPETFTNSMEFFVSLLTLSNKLFKLKECLTALGQDPIIEEIEITGRSLDEVFSDIRENLMEPFIKKPRELETFEIEEIKTMNEIDFRLRYPKKAESEAEVNETTEDIEQMEDVRIFGESGKLCVVNLERNIFLYGKFEFSLRYYGKLYYFFDEDAKNKFIENPEKYAPYYSAIRCYPPLRVFIMGPTGCGKSILAKNLGNQLSLNSVDYLQYLIHNLVPHFQFTSKKYYAVGDKKLLLGEDDNAEARLAKRHFINTPYKKRHYWLESSFYTDFSDVENFFEKIFQKAEPTVSQSFPQLTYTTVESILEENGDNFSSKTDSNLAENPYISMREIDPLITSYINNNSDLAEYFLEKALKILWNREPYIKQGFILEGFPLRDNDINTLLKNNWIPDVVINITLREEDIVERNIEPLMEFWDTKLKQEIAEEKLIEDSLHGLQKTYLTIKRNEMIKEKREEWSRPLDTRLSTDRRSTKDEDEIEDQPNLKIQKSEDLKIRHILSKPWLRKFEKGSDSAEPLEKLDLDTFEEVDKVMEERYPSFVFSPTFENYEAAKERITSNLIDIFRADTIELNKIKETLKDVDLTWFEIDGLFSHKEIWSDLSLKLEKVKNLVGRKGEFAFTVTMNRAQELLEQGFYFLSKFGRWCPVQVYRMKNPIHMFRPLNAKGKVTPVVYRNYIYFVAGEHEKKLFIDDPIKYTFNEPHHPNIPLRVAVIGPPKSGKSTLCKRLQKMFDLKVVTMGSALRFALEKTPHSTLAKSISGYLRRGSFLPLSLKIQALMLCLNDPSCVTQGFVFDGMPFDAAFTQSLAEKGKLPFVIISLVADSSFGKNNRRNLDLKQFRLPYKNRTNLDYRYNDWDQTYKRFAQWNQDTYNNLYEVNAKLNVVDIFYQAYDIIRKSFFGILYYVEYCVSDRALPLQYLCVSQHEYELRKSSFQNSCPVCWLELNRLNCSTDPPPRKGMVQYLNHFYWICSKHFEKFLENPKKFFPSNGKKCPEIFPKIWSRNEIEKNMSQLKIHGYGRCPVTRIDFPSYLDWEGSLDFGVFYNNEVFLCKNKEMMERFLATPWKYASADTKFEVNRPNKSNAVKQLGPPKMTSLPPIGFLEQTVADLIHECLQILGIVRPLYPNVSPTVTGCTFVALYLKVHNKKTKCTHLVKQCLDFMLRQCQPSLFLVSSVRYPQILQEIGQGDFEPDEILNSDSSVDETTSSDASFEVKNQPSDPYWLDPESQTDRRIWSAAYINDKFTPMKITRDDRLIEIPEVPKTNLVLKYQTYTLRPSPIPPVANCLTLIYSCKKSLELPEKFNYDSLHQTLPSFSLPFTTNLLFNPDKQFALPLYEEPAPKAPSKAQLRDVKRVISDPLEEKIKSEEEVDAVSKLLTESYFPRFQLLDRITIPDVPNVPKALELEPLFYNPHRDYAYTILFSEFFHTSHVLRCYEWDESSQFLEYLERLDKNLGLSKVPVDFIFKPQKPDFLKSRTSIDSYQRIFDASTKFFPSPKHSELELEKEDSPSEADDDLSLIGFLQILFWEKVEEVFERVTLNSLSYDSFEINFPLSEASSARKKHIIIQEVLPYPPLPWDIISRPYYAFCTISSVFEVPPLDNIAHKRHISVLDGLTEVEDDFKFVPYPAELQETCERHKAQKEGLITPFYFVYDFFNLPWTSFLTYPYSIAYNVDITNDILERTQSNESEKSEVFLK